MLLTENLCAMKTRTIVIGLLSLVAILPSCKKIKEQIDDATTVKINTNYVVDLPVVIAADLKSTNAEFNVVKTFDPLSSEDLADYQDKIKGFEVTGLTGTVSDLSTPVTLTGTKLKVSTASNSTEWNFPSLSIVNGSVITLDNLNGQWAKINSMLGEKKETTVILTGFSDQTNVAFNVQVKFSVVVTAKAL